MAAFADPRWRAVLRSLRGPAVFLVGPAGGVLLVRLVFGLPTPLLIAAGGMFAVSLAGLALLGRAEWRRLGGPP